jgi:hypothetical protein
VWTSRRAAVGIFNFSVAPFILCRKIICLTPPMQKPFQWSLCSSEYSRQFLSFEKQNLEIAGSVAEIFAVYFQD